MLQLTVGQTHDLNVPLNIKYGSTYKEIKSIQPLCMAKFNLLTDEGDIKVIAINNDNINLSINQVVYDLDNHIDENGTLIIRPSREFLFKFFSSDGISIQKAITANEHLVDLQTDIMFKVTDSLMNNGMLIMSDKEKNSYERMKSQWQKTTSVTLESNIYEIDYSLDGDGSIFPKGVKSQARKNTDAYKKILAQYKYMF